MRWPNLVASVPASTRVLRRSANRRWLRSARRVALVNARELLAEDSRTRYNLDVTLEELAAAARSLRIMADYIERNPDALIKGKGL